MLLCLRCLVCLKIPPKGDPIEDATLTVSNFTPLLLASPGQVWLIYLLWHFQPTPPFFFLDFLSLTTPTSTQSDPLFQPKKQEQTNI